MRKSLTLKNYGDGRTPLGDPPAQPKSRSKKDRKRWCGGKEGREHQGEWKSLSEKVFLQSDTPQNRQLMADSQARDEKRRREGQYVMRDLEYLICQACGKHLKWRRSSQAQ